MFGRLAFLVNGNMASPPAAREDPFVRVDDAESDELVASAGADVAVMGGREMTGWLRLTPEDVRTRRDLTAWVRRGVDHSRSLPREATGEAGAAPSVA